MRQTVLLTGIVVGLGASSAFAQPAIIYDNASSLANSISPIGIVTHPTGGFNGAMGSVGVTPDTINGFGHQTAAGNRLVDDFTVPAGFQWTITGLHVFGYVTGATTPQTTFGVAQIFDTQPVVGSVPIAGDTVTNIFTSAVFTDIYRGFTNPTDNARRVVDNTLTLATPLVLNAGTYWMEYGLTGNNFCPPLCVANNPGGVTTGNALQFTTAGGYLPLVDGTVVKGVPFQIVGTITPVPEPTSLALVGIGLAGYGWRRWRRK